MKIVQHLYKWSPAYILGGFQLGLYLGKLLYWGNLYLYNWFQLSILTILIATIVGVGLFLKFLLFLCFPKVYDTLDKKASW